MAGMRWTLVEMPLGGADQYTDAPHVVPGKMHDLQNVSFREPPKLAKRWGTNAAGTNKFGGGAISSGVALATADKETVLFDTSGDAHTYSGIHDYWRKVGRTSGVHVDVEKFDRRNTATKNWGDLAYAQTVVGLFWKGAGALDLWCTLIDTRTGNVYYEAQVSNVTFTPDRIRCCAAGNYIFAFFASSTALHYAVIDATTTSPAVSAAAAVNTTVSADSATFDVAPLIGSNDVLVSYGKTTTGEFNIDRIDINNTVINNYNNAHAVVGETAVYGTSGGNVWGAYDYNPGTSGVYFVALNDALSLVAGPSAASSGATLVNKVGIVELTTSLTVVLWEVTASSPKRAYLSYRIGNVAGGVSGAAPTSLADVIPHSKMWVSNSRAYCIGGYDDTVYFGAKRAPDGPTGTPGLYADQSKQPTYFVLELTADQQAAQTPRWDGTFLRGLADPWSVLMNAVSVPTLTDTKIWSLCNVRSRVRFGGATDQTVLRTTRFGLDIAKVEMAGWQRFKTARWGDSLCIAGGRPSQYDGGSVQEIGLAWRPENFEDPTNATTGGHIPNGSAGDVQIMLVYEWDDAFGNTHRSAPSDIVTHSYTGSGTNTNLLTITLRETLMVDAAPARCVPYRTAKGGTVFYRDSQDGFAATYGTAVTIGNLEDAALGTLTDDLEVQEVIYTTGDILDNAGLPPCKLITLHGDRLWLGATDDPEWIWFSQPYTEAEGPRFNEALRVLIGEPVTAMRSMDDQLIVFSRNRIYVVSGNGPPATGGLDIGFQVSLVTTDTGTDSPGSVVLTPAGIFFLGGKGVYLLTRALQLEWIGAEAKGYFDDYPLVHCAALSPNTTEVHFGASDTAVRYARRLVYNYATQTWAMYAPPGGEGSQSVVQSAVPAFVNSTLGYPYRYRYMTRAGEVYTETSTKWTEGSSSVPWQVVTAWLKLNTLQGWQRIRTTLLLIERISGFVGFGMRVQFAFDYNSNSFTETHSFSVAEIAALSTDQVEIAMTRQQCQAVRMRITETFDVESYNSPGPNLRSIVFEAGVKGRAMQLDATKARK